jgi:muramoyltetrapeptide carboxypeptidase LdcA involved in peptidoglycan recycling
MNMRYPQKLQKGDIIGICAPSAGVPAHLVNRLENAKRNLELLGYSCLETPSVRSNSKCVSADAKTRATEFMSLYENPEVRAIIPPWGGEFLIDMLPLIDFERMKTLQPKWVCGYSDITTLLVPLTLNCDMATIHGSNLMNMGYRYIHEADMRLFEAMAGDGISQQSAEFWGELNFSGDVSEPYQLQNESCWKSFSGDPSHAFSGRIIGGCLDVIAKIIGTPFVSIEPFLVKYQDDGFIWTLESCEMNAADIYRTFWQMRECGWFEYCNGMIIGRAAGYNDKEDFTLFDAFNQAFGDMNVPIIYDADIGHVPPQMQIINGAVGHVAYAAGKATILQEYK